MKYYDNKKSNKILFSFAGPYPSRIFVTNPRFDEGRPITLGTVDETGKIVAYPDYSWHDNQGFNCGGMTSVFRVAVSKHCIYVTNLATFFFFAVTQSLF